MCGGQHRKASGHRFLDENIHLHSFLLASVTGEAGGGYDDGSVVARAAR